MRIATIEDLHCNAGWRDFSFLKITTDSGLVGWSEYMESYGSQGLSAVIRRLGARLIGADPRPVERHTAFLHGVTRAAPGGMNQQAIAAIENALVDLKARALGVPVYELLGGPIRERLRLYWSHCGSYQALYGEKFRGWTGAEPIRTHDDIVRQGARVAAGGFAGLKTNIMRLGQEPALHMPGFNAPFAPDLVASRALLSELDAQMAAFARGAGPGVGLHLDLNFNFRTEGYIRVAQAMEDFDLAWLEIDSFDPAALAEIRRAARTRIASCESLFGRRQYRPYFEQHAVDVAIVDVPWKDSLLTVPPRVEAGELLIPTGIGWGAEVNEDVIRAHPPTGIAWS
ncbi:MAG: hypothetical protein KGI51_02850 [Rhodospirillales bacterium]|nr:hypothetical protein [Rhodospirillales bacterium]